MSRGGCDGACNAGNECFLPAGHDGGHMCEVSGCKSCEADEHGRCDGSCGAGNACFLEPGHGGDHMCDVSGCTSCEGS